MRLEYGFRIEECEIPRFAVEAVEGIGKLFTLATLVLNVLATKQSVEICFHGLNPEDPERIGFFAREIGHVGLLVFNADHAQSPAYGAPWGGRSCA